jgi:hypothetical protein
VRADALRRGLQRNGGYKDTQGEKRKRQAEQSTTDADALLAEGWRENKWGLGIHHT